MSSRRDGRAALPATADSFDEVVLPHLAAANRLARWLIRDEHDAEDAVQEASLRAFRHFRTFVGGDARAWFLRIVRNTCYGRRRGDTATAAQFDEEYHTREWPHADPETLLLRIDDAAALRQALCRLPEPLRRVLVLRELEGLTYRELADSIGIPIGTVMSRLSRARTALRGQLTSPRHDLSRARASVVGLCRRTQDFGAQSRHDALEVA